MPDETCIAAGMIDRIGGECSLVKFEASGSSYAYDQVVENHEQGVLAIIDILKNPDYAIIGSITEISGVGHRIVHGGEWFSESVIINPTVVSKLKHCNELAPLHNPANIKGVIAAQKLLPHAIQCGTFDTAFHQTMEPKAFMYAIPYEYYENHKIRKYGFHGSSHRYVSQEAAKMANKKIEDVNIIVCHLGNGASITAIKKGKSFDTTMGLTPLEGLMMGTRCGDLDLGASFHIMRKEKLSVDEIDSVFNKKSGFLGITGFSSDMRDIKQAAAEGNERAKLALQMFTYRIKKYIGSYAAAMGGVDIIAFTGGIGENNHDLRQIVCEGLEFLGLEICTKTNCCANRVNCIFSVSSSRVTAMVVQTNEEIIIARDTYTLLHTKI